MNQTFTPMHPAARQGRRRPNLPAVMAMAAFAALVTAWPAHAQPQSAGPAREAPQNIAQLSASGTVEVPQDWLTISMNTTREGSDALAVQTQLKQALDAALAEARKAAQPGQIEVRTGHFGLSPRHGRDGRINGWQGTTEMIIEGRDFARLSALAGRIQTLTLGQVGFSLSREARQKVEAEAQAQAIERFRAKAGDIAKAFGFAAYTLREVSVSSADRGPVPMPRMMAMEARTSMADAPVPVEAGKSSVTVTVAGSVQMK